ncbi:hypothetical protein C2E23DRAFT_862619 [Lenzites betulinus]|nr:hypothetical protein C2E23DRAFT_862619 [Lenzites betulinus]
MNTSVPTHHSAVALAPLQHILHSAVALAPLQHILTPAPQYQFIASTYVNPPAGTQATSSCQEPGCRSGQKLATGCSRIRCKKHCLEHPTPCGFKSHDQTRRALAVVPVPVVRDPFSLSHPPPVIPPQNHQPTTIQSHLGPAKPGSSTEPSPRNQREVMPDGMKRDWDMAMHQRLEKTRAVAQRRHNLLMVERTFSIHAWTMDGQPAIETIVQGPPTWPTIELAQLQAIQDLALQDEPTIQQFILATRSWVNILLTHKIKVRANEHILIRRLGVQDCPDLENVCWNATRLRGRMNGLGNPQRMAPTLTTQHYLPLYPSTHTSEPYTTQPWLDPRLTTGLSGHSFPLPGVVRSQATHSPTLGTLASTDSLMSIVSAATSAMSLGSDTLETEQSSDLPTTSSQNLDTLVAHARYPVAPPLAIQHFGSHLVPSLPSSLPSPSPTMLHSQLPSYMQFPPAQIPMPLPVVHQSYLTATLSVPPGTPRRDRPVLPKLDIKDLDQLWALKLVYAPPPCNLGQLASLLGISRMRLP